MKTRHYNYIKSSITGVALVTAGISGIISGINHEFDITGKVIKWAKKRLNH